MSKVKESIKEKDVYGQPISLNFKGSETFNTLPGGILSIFMSVLLVAYFVLRLKQMVQRDNWTLNTQDIL